MFMNQDVLDRRNRSIARGVATAHPVCVARALGVRVWEAEDREYLDFCGGIGAMNVGHNHPRVVDAVRRQLDRLTHAAFQVSMYEPYVRLAERLNALVGRDYKTMFLTTGTEAIENAVKFARAFTNRPAIVAFTGGFHGRSLLGMSLSASGSVYRQNFGPFAPEIYHSPFPDEYHGWTASRALDALAQLFESRLPPDRVAAFLLEPQLGEGGFVPAPAEFLQGLRRLADEHRIVLMVDEIQCGFGRTGKMFAYQHSGIMPDVVTMAKSLAAGMPVSAVVGKTAIMDAPIPGGLGGTYGGNPLACAAALAVLDIFEEEDLLERAVELGKQLRDGLVPLAQRHPQIGDVRGLGPMLAIELVKDRTTKLPDGDLALRILNEARSRGLLLLRCGPGKNVIRFLVPLVAKSEEISKGLAIIESSIQACAS
jgi:4-aminobutyrate aminotransferase/(S)-3-amino-2-methylpropionate transaminase